MSYSCQVALVFLMGVGRLQSAPIPTRPGKAAVRGPILRAGFPDARLSKDLWRQEADCATQGLWQYRVFSFSNCTLI
ncbi:uncharacterized protein BDZ83DRAFT_7072 [Colletotrichum acutatum]|uniref:Uncharacterized protein n=1 Tax=Glomerella acutata TaxID=27357 RepID=A0AAD8XR11_GLOAC|nr:uncharacterized protein BDZ83DRAFT_7072 [Colletotrichum acutatum]KAK1731853.1 hypothetical protein BDZ83DRAFT_7072 [Colletotrichum acutatum]